MALPLFKIRPFGLDMPGDPYVYIEGESWTDALKTYQRLIENVTVHSRSEPVPGDLIYRNEAWEIESPGSVISPEDPLPVTVLKLEDEQVVVTVAAGDGTITFRMPEGSKYYPAIGEKVRMTFTFEGVPDAV